MILRECITVAQSIEQTQMDFITLTCPRCQTRMTVVRSASPWLVCSRCLSTVEIPASHTLAAPVPVLPLETQYHRDSSVTWALILIIGASLLIGAALVFASAHGAGSGELLFLGAIGLTIIWSLFVMTGRARDSARLPALKQPSHSLQVSPSQVGTLNYARPRMVSTSRRLDRIESASQAIACVQFLLGCVGGSAAAVLVARGQLPCFSLFLIPCAATACLFVRSWHALAAGLAISVPISVLIFICICFADFKP